MNCKEAEQYLLQHFDVTQPEAMPAAVIAHLDTCAHCREYFRKLERMERQLLSQDAEIPIPDHAYFEALTGKILSQLDRNTASAVQDTARPVRHPRFSFWAIFRPIAGFAVLAVIAFYVLRSTDAEKQIPPAAQMQEAQQAVAAGEPGTTQPAPAEEKSLLVKSSEKPETTLSAGTPPGDAELHDKSDRVANRSLAAADNNDKPAPPELATSFTGKGERAQFSAPGDMRTTDAGQQQQKAARFDLGKKARRPTSSATGAAEIGALEQAVVETSKLHPSVPRSVTRPAGMSISLDEQPEMTAFANTMRAAQNADSDQERIQIWREFLKTNTDSTRQSLATYNLANALVSAADSTNDSLILAEAVDCFEKNERILRPLMGQQNFETQLATLREQLHQARIK